MDINSAVSEAVKSEVAKAVAFEMKKKGIDIQKEVRNIMNSKHYKTLIETHTRECFDNWIEDFDPFDDLPQSYWKTIMEKCRKVILK